MQSAKAIWLAVTSPFSAYPGKMNSILLPSLPWKNPFCTTWSFAFKRRLEYDGWKHIKWLDVSSTFTGT